MCSKLAKAVLELISKRDEYKEMTGVVNLDEDYFMIFNDGKLHSLDKNAVMHFQGCKHWYIKGVEYSYQQWFDYIMEHGTEEQQLNAIYKIDS